jgi:hypothetical protein
MTQASIGRSRTVNYATNLMGEVVKRWETASGTGGGAPAEYWYRYAGKEMGKVGNDGNLYNSYISSITQRQTQAGQGAFENGRQWGNPEADFGSRLEGISSYNQGSAAGTITARGGETLQAVAASLWGDSGLWYKLAQANGLSGDAALSAGQTLRIPAGVIRNTYNAATITPTDPADTLGDVNPTSPQAAPPKKQKCGMGQILLVVIAIVVVWKLAPHLIAKFATMAGKAAVTAQSVVAAMKAGTLIKTVGATAAIAGSGAAAAVGSIVSQSVGVATGIQEKFSWKDVGMAFISGGVGAGMAGVGGSSLGEAFVRGATSSAISQGIGVALGLQDKFSWAAVAAAGVTSVATQAISTAGSKYETVDGKQTRIAGTSWVERANHGLATALGGGELASQMSDAIVGAGVGMVGAMSGAAAQSLIDGSDFGDNLRAALPSIAGNMLASGVIAMLENACFVAGTQIQTVTGLKAIEDLKPGDWVYSRAESGDDPTIHRRQILETYRFEDKATLTLTFSTPTGPYTVTTTELHPFYVEGQGWTAAHELASGNIITLMNGGYATVRALEPSIGLTTVYNFAVDVNHTYFIGESGIWVHNQCRAEAVAAAARRAGAAPLTEGERLLLEVTEAQNKLALLDLLPDSALGNDPTGTRMGAIEEANAAYRRVYEFSRRQDGLLGGLIADVSGAGGLGVGVVEGVADGVVGIWNAVTNPRQTADAIVGAGRNAAHYLATTSLSQMATDGRLGLASYGAAINLEAAAIYLQQGSAASGFFVGKEAGKLLSAFVGGGAIARTLTGLRAVRLQAVAGGRASGVARDASWIASAGMTFTASLPRLLGNGALRSEVTTILRGNNVYKWTEALGVLHMASHADRLGFTFMGKLEYGAGNGIDGVFRNSAGGIAIWSAKGGTSQRSMSALGSPTVGRELSDMWIDNALRRTRGNTLNPIVQGAYDSGTLQRFATFRQSNTTYTVVSPTPTTVTGTTVRLP